MWCVRLPVASICLMFSCYRSESVRPGRLWTCWVLGSLLWVAFASYLMAGPVCSADPDVRPTGSFIPGSPCPVEELLPAPWPSIWDTPAGRVFYSLPGLTREALLGVPIEQVRGPAWPLHYAWPLGGRLDWLMVWASALRSAWKQRPCGGAGRPPCLSGPSLARLLYQELRQAMRVRLPGPRELEMPVAEVYRRAAARQRAGK